MSGGADQLRQFATQARLDAMDYRHAALQTFSSDRRVRLLKYASQREDDADFYDTQAAWADRFSEFVHQHKEAAE